MTAEQSSLPGDAASADPDQVFVDRGRSIGVVMHRRALANRWQSHVWTPVQVTRSEGLTAPRLIRSGRDVDEWLYPELPVELSRDEAEGYYLNLTAPAPAVFVHWSDEEKVASLHRLTVSSHEAARLMDEGMQVDALAMPAEWVSWVDAFVRAYYKPDLERKRSRPPPLQGAPDRRDLSSSST
jgi:hypothetical protein